MRLSLLLTLLVVALTALPACDSTNNNDVGATYVDFNLNATRYQVSADTRTASYETDDIDSGDVRRAVENALSRAGDGDLVMLYIKSYLVTNQASTDDKVYSALPLSRGFTEPVLQEAPDGAAQTINVVGITASYEYSFGNQNLYFDVVSSEPGSSFATPATLFNFLIPQRQDADGVFQGADRLEFRLVTVPTRAGQRSAVDLTDYAAVKKAYNLPD